MPESSRRTVRQQFQRLIRDYVFWRDTLSTLIGGLFVLIVAYTWAVLMGYLTSPGLWETILNFIKALAIPSVVAAVPAVTSAVAAVLASTALSRTLIRKRQESATDSD